MGTLTLAQICNAIESTLSAATGMEATQSYDELAEGVGSADMPMLQVFPDSGDCDISGSTDRTTFGGDKRQKRVVIHTDLLARQRSHLAEDVGVSVDMIDALIDVLEQQDTKPYFSQDGIKAFSWRWERVEFDYAGVKIAGARFYITVWMY